MSQVSGFSPDLTGQPHGFGRTEATRTGASCTLTMFSFRVSPVERPGVVRRHDVPGTPLAPAVSPGATAGGAQSGCSLAVPAGAGGPRNTDFRL